MDVSKPMLIGLVLTICAFVFQLIGLASPYWIFIDYKGTETHSGLWKTCTTIKALDNTECVDSNDYADWFKEVRATNIIGFLSVLCALVMILLKMFVFKDRKLFVFGAIGPDFLGGLFILISIAVYAAKVADLDIVFGIPFDYHFAFAFCIIAMLAAFGAGAVMMVDAVKSVQN